MYNRRHSRYFIALIVHVQEVLCQNVVFMVLFLLQNFSKCVVSLNLNLKQQIWLGTGKFVFTITRLLPKDLSIGRGGEQVFYGFGSECKSSKNLRNSNSNFFFQKTLLLLLFRDAFFPSGRPACSPAISLQITPCFRLYSRNYRVDD